MPVGPEDLDSFFNDNGLAEYEEAIRDELARSYEIGALREGLVKSQAQLKAVLYAQRHSGELVTGIDDTTRSRLKQLVSAAVDNGDPLTALRKRIDEDGLFGKDRAYTIARTETAFAHGRGAHESAQLQGQNEKSWVRNQEEPDDECQDNEDAGWIGIDEDFPSGDDTIPAHPNCECDVIYQTSDLTSEDDVADDEDQNDGEDVIAAKVNWPLIFANAFAEVEVY